MTPTGSATAMTRHARDTRPTGISDELASRLSRLKPRQTMRVIVMLEVPSAQRDQTRRMTGRERRETIDTLRTVAQSALVEVDEILKQFKGKRLEDSVSALGTVLVEATAAGIKALAQSPKIKAVIEDQPINRLPAPID